MEGQSGQKEHFLISINDLLILINDLLILINDLLILINALFVHFGLPYLWVSCEMYSDRSVLATVQNSNNIDPRHFQAVSECLNTAACTIATLEPSCWKWVTR